MTKHAKDSEFYAPLRTFLGEDTATSQERGNWKKVSTYQWSCKHLSYLLPGHPSILLSLITLSRIRRKRQPGCGSEIKPSHSWCLALETEMKDAIQEVIIALIFLSLRLCCCPMKSWQLKYWLLIRKSIFSSLGVQKKLRNRKYREWL